MNLDNLIYSGLDTMSVGERGDLLIAEPLMKDPWFARSVVLMLDRNDDGGRVGLMLNKQLPVTLAEIIPDWPEASNVPLFLGGPVDKERMFMLHTVGPELGQCFELLPGLYVGGDNDKITQYINTHLDIDGKLRFFVGYSGWEAAQLENELTSKSWAVSTPADSESLLSDEGDDFWRREAARLGENYRAWLSVPKDPMLN